MITVRAGRPEDAGTVAAVRAASWRAAYEGIIPADILGRLTSPPIVAARAAAMRERWPAGVLIAETGHGAPAGTGQVAGGQVTTVGFANFGQERGGTDEQPAAGGQDPRRAELYAIYVLPAYWSAGAGLALMREVLDRSGAAGFGAISVWVLERNARARRFYERAGFSLTGSSEVLTSLGGVTEIRYEKPLARIAG